ncbi:MAG: hypothetical protein U5L45_11835 [Saprospiraceae bacterium]|nr:hypothetical protein [Saprospiraceae bacterium]
MKKVLVFAIVCLVCATTTWAQLTTWERFSTSGADANARVIVGDNRSRTLWTLGEFKDSFFFGNRLVKGQFDAKSMFWTRLNMEKSEVIDFNYLISTGEIKANAALLARNGSLFLTGEFVGKTRLNGVEYTSEFGKMGFLMKIGSDGKAEWLNLPIAPLLGVEAKMFGIAQTDDNTFVTAVSSKNILTVNNTQYLPRGGEDSYLLSFDSTGRVLDFKPLGTPFDDKIESMAGDREGNIYIGGIFSGVMDLGNNISIQANGKSGYLAKFDKKLQPIWAKAEYQSSKEVKFKSIAVGGDGSVAAVAEFEYVVEVQGKTLQSNAKKDMLIVRYDKKGILQWAKIVGALNEAKPKKAVFDDDNNLYIVGEYKSGFRLAAEDTSHIVATCGGAAASAQSGFLVKYTPSGKVDFAKSISSFNQTKAESVWLDFRKDIYIAGQYVRQLQTDTNRTHTSDGNKDFFIAKINRSSCLFEYDNSKDFVNKDLVFLHQVYPNPSDGTAYFNFHILKAMSVRLPF